jgi:hypothetical protein
LQAHDRDRVDDREAGDRDHGGAARILAPVLDLFVDIDGRVPSGEGKHREQEATHHTAAPADSAELEPGAGDGDRPLVMP